jgi:hypothetical protein
MDLATIKNILGECEFSLFEIPFKFSAMRKGDGYLVQLRGMIKDNETGKLAWQHGGKHYISSHAIKDEVVNKAWKACFDFVVHEAREAFYYKGQTIYHPHFKVDELARFVATSEHARRKPPLRVQKFGP